MLTNNNKQSGSQHIILSTGSSTTSLISQPQQVFIPVSSPQGTTLFSADGTQSTLFTVPNGVSNQTQSSPFVNVFIPQAPGNPVSHQILQSGIHQSTSSGGIPARFIITQPQQMSSLIPMNMESLPPNCVVIPMPVTSPEALQPSVLSVPQSISSSGNGNSNIPVQMTNFRFINTNTPNDSMTNNDKSFLGMINSNQQSVTFQSVVKTESFLEDCKPGSSSSNEEALRSMSIASSHMYDHQESNTTSDGTNAQEMETNTVSSCRMSRLHRRGSSTDASLCTVPENGVQFAYSSNNNNKQCTICGDRSTGKHYGVYSCEGCKGFFKRTVRQKLSYICRDNNECSVDKQSRNRCQACRWRRCLSVGMKREYVQLKRPSESDLHSEDMCDDDYGQQESAYFGHSAFHSHRAHTVEEDPHHMFVGPCTAAVAPVISSLDPVDPEVLLTRILPDDDLNEEFVRGIEMEFNRPYPIYSPPNRSSLSLTTPSVRPTNRPERPRNAPMSEIGPSNQICVPTIVHACEAQLYLMIDWLKKIPQFLTLPLPDQICLSKAAWCEILCITFGYRSVEVPSGLVVCTGVHISPEAAHQWGVSYVIERIDQQLVQRLRSIEMDEVELGCMKLLFLFNPEVDLLENVDYVESMQQKVFRLLAHHATHKYPQSPSRFSELVLAMAPVQIISYKCMEQLFYLHIFGEAQLDKFLAEMLDTKQV